MSDALADLLSRIASGVFVDISPEGLRRLYTVLKELAVEDYRKLIADRFQNQYVLIPRTPPDNWNDELKRAYLAIVSMTEVRDGG